MLIKSPERLCMREQTIMMHEEAVCPECSGIGKFNSEVECRNCNGTGIVNYGNFTRFSSRFVFNSVTLAYLIIYALLIVF